MTKTRIATDAAPAPLPAFSQAVRKGPILAVSGQGGADPATGEFAAEVGAQTTRTLRNVLAILEAAGSSFDDVVMLRVYLTTQDDFPAMNAAYGAFMAEHLPGGVLPARTTVFPGLPFPQMLVEVDALAVVE